MIKKILEEIENQKMTISQWVLGFSGILFVRFLFESLSSPTSTGIIPSDPYTLVHYGLFFLSIILVTACIIGFITKNYEAGVKVILFGLPVIWLAPIIDILLSRGLGYKMTYIFDTHGKLLFDFLTFFGSNLTHGATYGIRVEIILILAGVGWYLWLKTKNISKTLLGVIATYVLGFVMASLPGILYTFSHFHAGTTIDVLKFFENTVNGSNIFHNTLHDGNLSVSASRFFELGFDKLMSQILFIISFFFGALLLWKIDSKKFRAVIGNIRLERISSYIVLLLCGAGFAYINRLSGELIWADLLGLLCLIISWVSLWMQAVHTNDVSDVKIDEISNTDRPLIKKELNENDMRQTGFLWLAIALLGSWSAGFYPFFMALVFVATSYIYSSYPLRLRRFPIIPSFLIGVASLATILAGFFFISAHKEIGNFPMLLAVGIVIMVTLAINVKDMRDIEGDRADGILTLPVLFGQNGAKIVGLCLALSFLLVPIFLSFYALYIFSIPAAIIGYKLVTKKPYTEKPLFILRFVFLACVAFSYLGVYWLAHLYGVI
ncbi:MAG TPA: UbiA family prenyltransferase [Candidatus Paceibacterota bacterium]|nr:1,4-dihydroxy-2-naphthoate octaprenyltransferase [uncultured archaeon]